MQQIHFTDIKQQAVSFSEHKTSFIHALMKLTVFLTAALCFKHFFTILQVFMEQSLNENRKSMSTTEVFNYN
jgi:hypothetical protein